MGVVDEILNNPLALPMMHYNYRGSDKPANPSLGDVYSDLKSKHEYIYTGYGWKN